MREAKMRDLFPVSLKPAGGICVGVLMGALLWLLVVAVIGAVVIP
jgi:hypothetical protein